jgi:hypothetical protein
MAINHPPVWRIKVVLVDTSPMVWRRFDTYATVTLSQLHYFIQGIMSGGSRKQKGEDRLRSLAGVARFSQSNSRPTAY